MKALYLAGTMLSLVVILILAFENIQASCNYLIFFFWELPSDITPTMILFGSAFMGMVSGVFLTLFATSVLGKSEEEEEDENFNA
ncbi:MAG: hypothetical protein ACD_28C00244G0010 [uncultured bacterium]|nr:MAG: hypothetical protein ACD_28C00244G0010 [uncultured bacterium]KKT75963.1 MAG: hypothetical protein UW70_C0025G0011 [Candidatus Peregrinibacteria bacterium GW2011_GWA2_44_7]